MDHWEAKLREAVAILVVAGISKSETTGILFAAGDALLESPSREYFFDVIDSCYEGA